MSGPVPQFQVGGDSDLVDVRLLGLPVAVHQAATEHIDELRREFALLRLQQADAETPDVPDRLLRLVEDLEQRFARFAAPTRAELEEAIERGAATVDLVYRVPPEVRLAVEDLSAALDAADDYCRAGDGLLTLATPPEAVAYRRWYLSEFARQADGGAPRPWQGS